MCSAHVLVSAKTVMCVLWLWHRLSTMLDGWCWAPLPPQARKVEHWNYIHVHVYYGDNVNTYHNGVNLHLFYLSPFCPLSIYRKISLAAEHFPSWYYFLYMKLCMALPLRLITIQCAKTQSCHSAHGLHPFPQKSGFATATYNTIMPVINDIK